MQREGPRKLNLEGLETQRWLKSTEGTQIIDEKNGISCLGIMFYCQNSQIYGQNIMTVWAKCLCASERNHLVLLDII